MKIIYMQINLKNKIYHMVFKIRIKKGIKFKMNMIYKIQVLMEMIRSLFQVKMLKSVSVQIYLGLFNMRKKIIMFSVKFFLSVEIN
jgi:hypothetical protein